MLGAALVTSMLAAGVGFAGTAGASVASANAGSTALVAVEPASTALLPAGTHTLGALDGNTELQLDVNLQLPDPAAVESFIAAVDDSSSPLFHHYLARGQFGARFGPSAQTVSTVVSALRSAGLEIGPVASDRLSIPVSATASRVEAAFHTRIDSYRLPSGRVAYANSAPAELPGTAAAAVSGIVGLSDVTTFDPLYTAQRQARSGQHSSDTVDTLPQRPPGPQPCPKATAAASKYGAYTSNQLASFYGMSPLYGVEDFGQGVYVGLVEFDTFEPSNIATFEACFGTRTPLTITKVDGFHKTGVGGGEPVLDIEDFLGLAPGATVDVYETPNTLKGAEDIYKKIITDDVDNVVSTSWGECELDSTHSFLKAEQSLFMQAATQGEAVFAAAGDSGSTDCYLDTGSPNTTSLAVDDPSSQPYVVGVGGTSITGAHSQALWNTPDIVAATGGGDSADWCMPSYQYSEGPLGVINPNSDHMAGCSTRYAREVPDVSADANPYTGLVVYYSAQFSKKSGIPAGWQPIGGTSVAAPIWAALAALTDSSPFCSSWDAGTPGGLPQALYGVADGSSYASGYYDVTKGGSNDLAATGYTGGLYPVRAGYDMATGMGTPVGVRTDSAGAADWDDPGLVALTCRAFARHAATISGISPDAAPLGHAVTAEITGSGFVPLPDAESVEVGSRWLSTVNCTTTTSCTVTLPAASAASKVDVRVDVGGVDTTEPTSFAYDKVVPEGYWLASSDGSVFSAGKAPALGGVNATGAGRITGIAATPDGRGYWLVGQDGSVSIKGDAHFVGDLPESHVVANDIVAIAPTGDGRGYWLIGRDGGEFAFGDARFHGSLPGVHVHVDDITGMVATSDGGGYWLVASDGGIFAFGDATYVGSLPGVHTHTNDITAMIASPTRHGYVLVGRDGGTFVFGSGVQYFGSLPSRGVHVDDISGLALTGGGLGYWLAGSSGAVYGFGDAQSFPTPAGIVSHLPIVAIAAA
jgi:hypothetical protein